CCLCAVSTSGCIVYSSAHTQTLIRIINKTRSNPSRTPHPAIRMRASMWLARLALLSGCLALCVHPAAARDRRSRYPVRHRSRRPRAELAIPGGSCETIQVPMCKNLIPYNTTQLPNQFGHSTQAQVYWAMQRWWPFMDAGCSDNLRNFLCALYLPQCVGDQSAPLYPCMETCRKAKQRCRQQMRRQGVKWNQHFKCKRLLSRATNRCVKPQRESKKAANREYVLCEANKLSMCQNIPFTQGSLPNMYLQSDLSEIEREMSQYAELVSGGCSRKLRLFLCGVFMPFCVQGRPHRQDQGNPSLASSHLPAQLDVPFVVPCREWCQEVYDQCSGEYEQRTQGLPWPGKFHCHRFPSYTDQYGRRNSSHGGDVQTIPCTMPPLDLGGD
ncbi:hypothetical protein EGW08_000355, partial [Elysia chlorotica]